MVVWNESLAKQQLQLFIHLLQYTMNLQFAVRVSSLFFLYITMYLT